MSTTALISGFKSMDILALPFFNDQEKDEGRDRHEDGPQPSSAFILRRHVQERG
ncbi:MAG: hypothetical protein IMZ50_14905 [Candidatus Atribacteria bacterium]|nr:hypothetical protein [Candidatus Atribacteria bacterium]